MPSRPLLKFLVLAGVLSFATPALHAQIVPGARSNVTLTLTVSYSEDNDDKYSGDNTIYSGRIVKMSYGNKQLIEDMNEAGDLPDNTVTGWKLVAVNRDPEGEGDVNAHSFYLVKAGQTPVLVPYLYFDGEPKAYVDSYTETENRYGETISGKSTFRAQLGLKGSLPPIYEDSIEFEMTGLLAGSDKTGPVKISNEPFNFQGQIVSARLGGIVGALYYSYYNGYDYTYYDEELIEGSVSFSAATPIDIIDYPAAIR